MIITISGHAGSGKSTIAEILARRLGYEHYSIGAIQRMIAKEKGVSITELGKLEAEDGSLDRMVDEKQKELGKKDNIVVDSWLGAFFIPHSVKIFLDASIDVRAKRRTEQRKEGEKFKNENEAKKDMLEREEINRKRWLKYYGFDYADKRNYDYCINTDSMSAEETAEYIISLLKKDGKI